MNWNKKDVINICKIIAFSIILYWLLQNLGIIGYTFKYLCNILAPFIVGGAIAFIINIPMTVLESKRIKIAKIKKKNKNRVLLKIENKLESDRKVSKIKRLISILISLFIIITIIVGIVFLVIPELLKVLTNIINYIPQLLGSFRDLIKQIIVDHPEVEGILTNIQVNLESFSKEMIKELTSIGTSLVTSSFGVITSTIKFIVNLVLSIIFAIYILMGKEKIIINLKRIIYAFLNEKVADEICKVAKLSKVAFYNFITGQFTECIILGSLCALGMFFLRIPYAVIVGVIVAITAFIPIVGAMIGGIIGIILLLPISTTKAIVFLIFFVILQQVENNLIYPKVVGNSVGVPGILVLVAITIGGSVAGAVGMVICLPITSVLYTLLRESTNRRLKVSIH